MKVCLVIFIGHGGGLGSKARARKGENAVGKSWLNTPNVSLFGVLD